MENEELDNSYLSLLFEDQVYIEKPIKSISQKKYDLVVYATHNPESIFEENLSKCFQRLKISLDNALRTKETADINDKIPTIVFSDNDIEVNGFPAVKYSKEGKVIWFDSFETISKDPQLKMIFWDKFQEFFKP